MAARSFLLVDRVARISGLRSVSEESIAAVSRNRQVSEAVIFTMLRGEPGMGSIRKGPGEVGAILNRKVDARGLFSSYRDGVRDNLLREIPAPA